MIVSLLGLTISLFAYLIAFPERHQRRFEIYGALLVYHLAACVVYWAMSFEDAVDAYTYWRDPYNFIREDPLASGTYFIVHIVQRMRQILGGTFLDHFLFFQCFGMLGIALMIRIFNEIADSLNMSVPLHVYLLLFIPGLHFWTAMIGKDGLMLLAGALAMWASMHIQRRLIWMLVAIILMLLVRTHVAAVALMAIVGAFFVSKQVNRSVRLLMLPVAGAALVFVLAQAGERFNVSLLDPESLTTFFENQQSLGDRFSRTDLESLPYPLKVWSLLFRPFFFDESGLMAVVASFENTILIYIFGYIVYHWRLVVRLVKNANYIVYCLIFSSVLILLLSLVNYNLGLGLRQKMMAIPAVLVIYVTIYMYKRYLAVAAATAVEAVPDQTGQTAAVQA